MPGFSAFGQTNGYSDQITRFGAYIDTSITAQDIGTIDNSAVCTYSGYRTKDTTNVSSTGNTLTTTSTNTNVNDINAINLPIRFEVIPNPNNGIFSFSGSFFSNAQGQFHYSIADALGNIVLQEKVYNVGDIIHADILENGVYYLNFKNDNSGISTVKKLVITK